MENVTSTLCRRLETYIYTKRFKVIVQTEFVEKFSSTNYLLRSRECIERVQFTCGGLRPVLAQSYFVEYRIFNIKMNKKKNEKHLKMEYGTKFPNCEQCNRLL